MARYLAGVVSALMLVAAGVFLFRSNATTERSAVPAPQTVEAGAAADGEVLPQALPKASAKTREERRFGRYDKDRDGGIARDEYLASRRKAYVKLDTNGDGRLSFDEWAAKTTAKFAGADRDRSGSLSATEFATTAVIRKSRPRAPCPPASAD